MEILAIVVVILIVMLVIGSIANATPISSWSDEKLQRMYGKFLRAANPSNDYLKKSEEVRHEIETRKKQQAAKFATEMADQLAPSIHVLSERAMKLVQRTMQEEKVGEEAAREIVGNRLKETNAKFLARGMTEEQANAASMKEIFNL